jgi:hypothetical protein
MFYLGKLCFRDYDSFLNTVQSGYVEVARDQENTSTYQKFCLSRVLSLEAHFHV